MQTQLLDRLRTLGARVVSRLILVFLLAGAVAYGPSLVHAWNEGGPMEAASSLVLLIGWTTTDLVTTALS